MSSPVTLTLEDEDAESAALAVDALLEDANQAAGYPRNKQMFCATLRGDRDVIVGGIVGYAFWEWLYIGTLAVVPAHRGQGHAQRLLASCEDWAANCGCRHAWLMTMTFQARAFYERAGYSLFAELPDYATGSSRLFLRKTLTRSSEP